MSQKEVDDKCLLMSMTTDDHLKLLQDEKANIQAAIKAKEEKLRKLRMVKMYRKKVGYN